jgi:hypothetical protein
MLLARWAVLLLLGSAVACFAAYALTGELRYRVLGLKLVKWTLAAAAVFFGVLIAERVHELL